MKTILACVFAGCSIAAFAAVEGRVATTAKQDMASFVPTKACDIPVQKMSLNGSKSVPQKAAGALVQWQRPRGQFYTVGWDIDANEGFYPYGTLLLRPWTEYTYRNVSTASGTPLWEGQWLQPVPTNPNQLGWENYSFTTQDVTFSYFWGEFANAPLLSYRNVGSFGYLYDGDKIATQDGNKFQVTYGVGTSMEEVTGVDMPVSSQFFNVYGRKAEKGSSGITRYYGLEDSEGDEWGWFFGTNAQGVNAGATRFEKPEQPYLLKSVYYYYVYTKVTKEIPLKAYVFKTVNDALEQESTSVDENGEEVTTIREYAELGELLATAEAVVPIADAEAEDQPYGLGNSVVRFDFVQKNPVTGAISSYDLEIDDDIIVVVTGFDELLGAPDNYICSSISTDTFDEGYGNLGFVGSLDITEDGSLSYNLIATKNLFGYNTTAGIWIGVEYPWVRNLMFDESEIRLGNEGETMIDQETGEIVEMGLQMPLYLYSTGMTDDMEVTFDGEDECDWLSITDVVDYTEEVEGEEIYTGQCMILFEAEPNPSDESRVTTVKVSIPAASYEITFLQGSNAQGAVDVVVNEANTIYYDLMGRRVANPDKGIYIKKAGKTATKVVL